MRGSNKKFVFGVVLVVAVALVVGRSIVAYGKDNDQRGDHQDVKARFEAGLARLAGIRHERVCGDQSGEDVSCHARVVVDSNGRTRTFTTPSGYGPTQFLDAYGLTGTAVSGAPLIAIVDAYDHPRIQNDLNNYSATFGIPTLPACTGAIKNSATPCFQKVNQSGQTRSYPRSNAGWDLEIALDVEAAHATCQNCRVLLVEANSASYTDLLKAVDTATAQGAVVVSGSWGGGEFSGESAYDSHFNKTGVAFTFSAGDSGYGSSYPAASPYVTAVGGTSLLVNPDNSYLGEQTWSGTGSGCSAYETKPAWQSDPLCKKRTIGDVAADADPATGAAVYDSVAYAGQVGWFQVGGTSLSAPLIAAVYAEQGIPSASRANSLPYSQGTATNLHDITTGTNGSCGTYLCGAAVGYDGPTGLGSPNGSTAF
ncbi:MAG TPA: S53 family peptidase [Candidatus Paceibacterota bacterium]|nr:S53 family peptidase [Candidatus Paceibacterota bacterium]